MASDYETYVALFEADAGYRAWFKRWWAQDYSLEGRKQSLERNSYANRHSFGGRTWVQGWAPPHDLQGNPNPSFSWVNERSVRSPLWEYIRSDLSGSYIEGGGPGFLSHSAANMAFCCIARDIIIDPPANRVGISDSYFAGRVVLQLQRQVDIDLVRALIGAHLTVTSSRPVRYDISSAVVRGDARIEGGPAEGIAHKARVTGSLTVQGAITATNLRAGAVTINRSQNSSGEGKALLASLRTRELSISGAYSEIQLGKCRSRSVDLNVTGCELLSVHGIESSSFKIKMKGKTLDLKNSRFKKQLEFRDTAVEALDMTGCECGTVSGRNLVTDRADLSNLSAAGQVLFDRCEFGDELVGRGAVFDEGVSFARCALPGVVDFGSAHFRKGASFKVGSGADIAKSPGFKQIGEANFSGTKFDAGPEEVCANFDGRETLEAASFEAATFSGIPMFYECEFHENISFRGATFHIVPPRTPYWSAVSSLGWAMFSKEALASFRWLRGIDARRFARAWKTFRAPLSVRRAIENHRLSRYERAYNALRQRFSEVGNAKYERQFHNYELRARRRRIDADAPPVESAVSWIYDFFSQYGQSISRPLAALFFLWLGCAIGYFAFAGVMTLDGVLESAVFSGRQIVKPFSAWSRDFALAAAPLSGSSVNAASSWIEKLMMIGTEYEVVRATLVRIIATVQSFVAIVLLFLSGLAVRRTFGVG